MVLNPALYNLLDRRFAASGGVRKINKENESASYQEGIHIQTGRPIVDWSSRGEQYIVICPFCADQSGHLYISHLYGMPNEFSANDNIDQAKCWRRDCLQDIAKRDSLYDLIFAGCDRDQRLLMAKKSISSRLQTDRLLPVELPGEIIRLQDLPANHHAVVYLRDRGFDLEELEECWRVRYCLRAWRYSLLDDRIFIPVFMNAVLVGWQGRQVADAAPHLPKYYTLTDMPKRLTLYNFDAARVQPLVVIMEGPTDVWRLGACGVCLLGKTMSEQQLQLLHDNWSGKPIIVCLDADDPDAVKAAEGIFKRIYTRISGSILNIRLPEGKDPADLTRLELRQYLVEEAARQDVDIRILMET